MQVMDTPGNELPGIVILIASGCIALLPMSRRGEILLRTPGGELAEKPVLRTAATDARNLLRHLPKHCSCLPPGSRGQGFQRRGEFQQTPFTRRHRSRGAGLQPTLYRGDIAGARKCQQVV